VSIARRVKRGRPRCALRPAGRTRSRNPCMHPPFTVENDTSQLHEFHAPEQLRPADDAGEMGGWSPVICPCCSNPMPRPKGHLIGHMARANPQWRQVDGEVLVVFLRASRLYLAVVVWRPRGRCQPGNYGRRPRLRHIADHPGAGGLSSRSSEKSVRTYEGAASEALELRRVGAAHRSDAQGRSWDSASRSRRSKASGRLSQNQPEGAEGKTSDSGV